MMSSVKIKGFSLVEVMVTLSVAAIMISLAAPNLQIFMLKNRLGTQKNEFVLALAYAKSEAVRRGVTVSVCARATDQRCRADNVWDGGWLVFVDSPSPQGDGIVNGTDSVLQVRPPLEGGNTLRAGARSYLAFRSNGFPGVGSRDVFAFSDSRGPAGSMRVCISQQGGVSIPSTTADPCPL